MFFEKLRPNHVIAAAAALFLILGCELVTSIRQESQTFDESAHLYAGYAYWKRGDFGINPEHPPLAKMVAALPLLPTGIAVPSPPKIYFRGESVIGGLQLLYSHDAEGILFRSRLAISVFTFALGGLIFLAAYEMFGAGAALLALALFVFEPNMLAHGALITTDMPLACCLFAAIYAFYRYVKRPSAGRLILCGVAAGLTLAVKHSGLLLGLMLLLLAGTELMRSAGGASETRLRVAMKQLQALAVIAVIAVGVLWSFYGFRYAARPGKQTIIPPTAAFLQGLHHEPEASLIRVSERAHLLPEAYLYGLTDVAILNREGRSTFLLGKLYPSGRWFYFPVAFLIKSTLPFLVLLLLVFVAKKLRTSEVRREVLFVAIPPAIFFLFAMLSKLDIGLRHILPIYPFLIVLAAAAAAALAQQSRGWSYAIAALVLLHAASSFHAYPDYLPYSNEIWGGPNNTHRVLADSNVGWEGGLLGLQRYVKKHGISHCWLGYDGPVDPSYYHLPCTPLPSFFGLLTGRNQPVVPEQIEGPIFVGSLAVTGIDDGPESVNAYAPFRDAKPRDVVQGEILMFDGKFNVPRLSARSHLMRANGLLQAGHMAEAIAEAKVAAELEPDSLYTHELLSFAYARGGQPAEATREYEVARRLYAGVYSKFSNTIQPPQNPVASMRSAGSS